MRAYDAKRPGRGKARYASMTPERRQEVAQKAKEWREENPERYKSRRDHYYYPRPEGEVSTLRAVGKCFICESTDPRDSRGFHIDHDHSCCPGPRTCGQCIRALLCGPCNTLVGKIEKNAGILDRVLDYIKTNPRVNWGELTQHSE